MKDMPEAGDSLFTLWDPGNKRGQEGTVIPVFNLEAHLISFLDACLPQVLSSPKEARELGPSLQHMTYGALRDIQDPNSSRRGIHKDLHNSPQS